MTRHISTAAIDPGRRLHAWQCFHNDVFFDLQITPAGRPGIEGSVLENQFGAIGIANGKASAHRIVRRRTARGGDESFLLKFVFGGSIDSSQRHRRRTAGSGEVVLLNAADHFECEVADSTEATIIKIPCHALRARLPWIDDACLAGWASRSTIGPSVAAFLRGVNADRHGRRVYPDLERACLDLVSTMLDSSRRGVAGAEISDEGAVLLTQRLRRYIDMNVGRLGLSAADAAAAFRISERQVQKLFAREQTTFGRELMSARLSRASALLADPANHDLSVGEISFRCGFASQANFSSRYRDRYGVSPRESRSSGLATARSERVAA